MGFDEDLVKHFKSMYLGSAWILEHATGSTNPSDIYMAEKNKENHAVIAQWAYDYAKQESQWQPIETAPKHTQIMGFVNIMGATEYFVCRLTDVSTCPNMKDYKFVDNNMQYRSPSLWKPLEPPPQSTLHRHGSNK